MEHYELPWHERGRLWLRLGTRALLIGAVLLLLVLAAPPILSLLMPFVLAFIMAWLLNPPVRWIQKKTGAPRGVISLVIILFLFAVVGSVLFWFGYTIVSEVRSLAANWSSIWVELQLVLEDLTRSLTGLLKMLPDDLSAQVASLMDQFLVWLKTAIPSLLGSFASGAGSFAMSIPAFLVATVIFMLGWYFITADYPHIRFRLSEHLAPGFRNFLSSVKGSALGAFGGYVKAQVMIAIVVFFILLAGFVIVGQGYALLLAFLLAVLDFIPIVGSGTVMIPWAVIDLLTGNPRHAVEMMVIWGIIALFRRIAEPKAVGDQTGLSPILSLISIYVGMRLGGVLGMIVGPILCMVIINIIRGGLFDGLLCDLRLALNDVIALLKNRPLPASATVDEGAGVEAVAPQDENPSQKKM